MSDLTDLQASQTVKIAGANPSTGVEDNFAQVDVNGQIFTKDVINGATQFQAISVTSSAVEAKGAATRLVNRKVVVVTPTNGTVYWGTTTSVTTITGTPIFKNQMVSISFTDNAPVYLVSAGTVDVRIIEGS